MLNEKFIKVGNVRFDNDGTVTVELPKPQNIDDIQITAGCGIKEWKTAKKCLKKRIDTWADNLSQNIGSSCADNGVVSWVGGHFSIRAYRAMQSALLRKGWEELNPIEALHTMKAVHFYVHLFADSCELEDSTFEFACACLFKADNE